MKTQFTAAGKFFRQNQPELLAHAGSQQCRELQRDFIHRAASL
jgi:hypothetical protein